MMSSGSTEHISRDDDADKWVIPSDKETLRVVLNQEGDDGTIITKVEGLEVEYGDAYPQVPGGVDVNQHDVLPFDDLDGFSDPVEGPLLGIKAAEMRPEAPFPENEVSYDESLPPSSPPCSSPAPSLTSSPCNEPGTVHKRDIESVKSKVCEWWLMGSIHPIPSEAYFSATAEPTPRRSRDLEPGRKTLGPRRPQ